MTNTIVLTYLAIIASSYIIHVSKYVYKYYNDKAYNKAKELYECEMYDDDFRYTE
jgi:hypothetical protein